MMPLIQPVLCPLAFGSHSFHTSSILRDDRYLINGTEITRTDILQMKPLERSVAHWQVLVDWDRQASRPFVIVDPFDPTGLLYLNQAEYLSQSKVAASTNLPVLVVARPGTKGPIPLGTSSSQNSPLPVGIETKWTRQSRASWKAFLEFRSRIRRALPVVNGSTMVSESSSTIHRTVYLWARELAHYTEVKNSGMIPVLLQPLASKLASLLTHNGRTGTITYLKVSLFVLYSFMAGNPLKSTVPLGWGIRLRNGLPADWAPRVRSSIRSGNLPLIRIMASLLNLYRAMDAKHPRYSLKTIEQPHPDFTENQTFREYQLFCDVIFPQILATLHDGAVPPFEYESAFGLMLKSAGANYSPAMASIVDDAKAWASAPVNYAELWFKMHGDEPMRSLLRTISKEYTPSDLERLGVNSPSTLNGYMGAARPTKCRLGSTKPILGRLHTIDEPAGKVRIVAICDYWTQAALKPVHSWLFKILARIPQDATFDQDGTVTAYYQRELSPHWSYDLKSATDLIPIALYKACLGPLFRKEGEPAAVGHQRADLWSKIIADREFALPHEGEPGVATTKFTKYGTGQPMGALSSWASMALVHHSIVQFAAFKATGQSMWYTDYLVLGDDVDIARNEAVSSAYRATCQSFSIIIGLHKSLSSNSNCFEFANRRFHPLGDISPISFREELSARTWTSRWEFAKRICSRLGKSIQEVPAVLRRAVTSAQWEVIRSEMAGKRPSSLSRLVQYCLLNPLQSHSEITEVRISHLLDWLAKGLSLEQARVARSVRIDTEEGRVLERDLAQFLIREIEGEFTRMISTDNLRGLRYPKFPESKAKAHPELWSEKLMEFGSIVNPKEVRSLWQALSSTQVLPPVPESIRNQFWDALDPVDDEYMSHLQKGRDPWLIAEYSPYAWKYFQSAVYLHNGKVLQDIFELHQDFTTASRRVPLGSLPVLSLKPYANGYPNYIGELLRIWIELLTLPKMILYDLNYSVSWNLHVGEEREFLCFGGTMREFKDYKDRLWKRAIEPEIVYGPMSRIASFLAERLGLAAPNIPFFAISRRPRHWIRSLNRALSVFRSRESVMERYRLGLKLLSRLNSYTALRAFARDSLCHEDTETGGGRRG